MIPRVPVIVVVASVVVLSLVVVCSLMSSLRCGGLSAIFFLIVGLLSVHLCLDLGVGGRFALR